MVAVSLSLLIVFLILVLSELLWNHKKLKGELGRKFVHITVGSFVAVWPFYMSFRTIQFISLAFLAVVLLSRYLKLFAAVNTVDRKSWGDILFAVGIGFTATLTQSKWVFLAAMLNLSLADGLAAIIGKHYGKTSGYKVFNYAKSVLGTLTFWAVSVVVLLFVRQFSDLDIGLALILGVSFVAALFENVGIYGLDNLLVPALIAIVLNTT